MFDRLFTKFTKTSETVVIGADYEARSSGASTIEAEHILLALAGQGKSDVAKALAEVGLGPEEVRTALAREFESSLVGVGASSTGLDLPDVPPRPRSPRWGASAKRALERAVKIAEARGERRVLPAHLLLGVLAAEVGTVPRALAVAGVSTSDLTERTEALLTSDV